MSDDGTRSRPAPRTAAVQVYAHWWNGRTPTAAELTAYEAEGRRRRRMRDLTHAIEDAIARRQSKVEGTAGAD